MILFSLKIQSIAPLSPWRESIKTTIFQENGSARINGIKTGNIIQNLNYQNPLKEEWILSDTPVKIALVNCLLMQRILFRKTEKRLYISKTIFGLMT